MRFINKSIVALPQQYNNFISTHPGANYRQLKRSGAYKPLKGFLYQESGGFCAYCEKLIRDPDINVNNSPAHVSDIQIEHIMPKGKYPSLAVKYVNLIAGCVTNVNRGIPDSGHCGQFKGDNRIFVTPVDLKVESRFSYEASGVVKPADNGDLSTRGRIEKTIDVLNLNETSLVNSRRQAIANKYPMFLVAGRGGDVAKKKFIEALKSDVNGKEFAFVVYSHFKEKIL